MEGNFYFIITQQLEAGIEIDFICTLAIKYD